VPKSDENMTSNPQPFIVMCAPNGARRTQQDHPRLPITPAELADCASEVMVAGASILHLHVRDEHQHHSLDVDHYRRAIDAITDRVGDGLVIQVTSEAVGRYSRREQMVMVKKLKPEAVSLALRELAPEGTGPTEMQDFFNWMHDHNICPQIILYDETDFQRYKLFQELGVFGDMPKFLLFVVKKPQPAREDPEFSSTMFKQFPPKITNHWAACCFGKDEHNLATFCAQSHGHVRVGFENNLWRPDGTLASNNAELVQNACNAARGLNRTIATANDVRRLLVRAQCATILQKPNNSIPN